MSRVIIYHKACSDGFCAAWVAQQKWPDAITHAARHGDDPPLVGPADDIFIADFSYSRDVLQVLAGRVNSLVLLDHHVSAAEHLIDLPYCTFDMQRSGAGMTWDYCFPGQSRPWLVDYIEDNDLWRHALPGSRAVAAVVRSTPFIERAYAALAARGLADVVQQGESLLTYESTILRAAVRNAGRISLAGYHDIPCTNSFVLQSDIGNALAIGAPFAVVWYVRKDGSVQLSLRAAGSVDVSAVAAQYGGGGHVKSAGCTLAMEDFVRLLG